MGEPTLVVMAPKILKKAVAVLEEEIQESSRRQGRYSEQPFSLLESAPKKHKNVAGMAFRVAGQSGKNCPAESNFARKPFQHGILSETRARGIKTY